MFSIGDEIVCIDASMQLHTVEELRRDIPNWVKEGQQYHVRGIADHDFVVGLYLEEIHNPHKWFKLVNKYAEPAFATWRFRKIERVTREISVEQEELITL